MRSWGDEMDDATLLAHFQAAEVPAGGWDHRAQLRILWICLRREPFGEALCRVRRGLQQQSRAAGPAPDRQGHAGGAAPLNGRSFHATLTLAWARLVEAAMTSAPESPDSRAFLARHPELLAEGRIGRHYSPERMGIPRARWEFVLPDRAPLPRRREPKAGRGTG